MLFLFLSVFCWVEIVLLCLPNTECHPLFVTVEDLFVLRWGPHNHWSGPSLTVPQSSKFTFLLFTVASFHYPVDFHPDKSPFLSHYSSLCAIAPPLNEAIKKKGIDYYIVSVHKDLRLRFFVFFFFLQESLIKLPIEWAQICIAAHDACKLFLELRLHLWLLHQSSLVNNIWSWVSIIT